MSEKFSILIIDDNIDDRELYKRTIAKAMGPDVKILELASGDRTVELIEEEDPSCVLLDYSLPGRNGLEVLKRIRAKKPDLPVIMLTGQGNETVAVQAMKLGAQDYIIKSSINPESLFHVVKIAMEHCNMKRRISSQQQALQLFTRALAHDLKAPLRTIQSFVGLIKVDSYPEERSEFLTRISRAAGNMDSVIKSVRIYTELNDIEDFKRSHCDLNKVVRNVLENLDTEIKESGAQIQYDVLPPVRAHEPHMLQLLQNLVSNAIQYSHGNPNIYIGVNDKSEYYEIFVKDNGPGVDEKFLKDIFQPFKRFNKKNRSGSGLGLAISKKIVESHQGKIWCDSQKDSGAIFYFTMPKELSLTTPESSKNLEKNQKPTQKLANVLLIDDSVDDLYLAKVMLLERGQIRFNLYSASNGQEALDFLKNPESPKINLILLDINMPIMDGFEFLKEVKSSDELTMCPIIMCSTSDYVKDKEAAQDLGALDYLVKPLSRDIFVRTVDKIKSLRFAENGSANSLKLVVP